MASDVNTPPWVNVLVAFTALVGALGVAWKQIAKPAVDWFRGVLELLGMLPWLRRLRRASENLLDDEKKTP